MRSLLSFHAKKLHQNDLGRINPGPRVNLFTSHMQNEVPSNGDNVADSENLVRINPGTN